MYVYLSLVAYKFITYCSHVEVEVAFVHPPVVEDWTHTLISVVLCMYVCMDELLRLTV